MSIRAVGVEKALVEEDRPRNLVLLEYDCCLRCARVHYFGYPFPHREPAAGTQEVGSSRVVAKLETAPLPPPRSVRECGMDGPLFYAGFLQVACSRMPFETDWLLQMQGISAGPRSPAPRWQASGPPLDLECCGLRSLVAGGVDRGRRRLRARGPDRIKARQAERGKRERHDGTTNQLWHDQPHSPPMWASLRRLISHTFTPPGAAARRDSSFALGSSPLWATRSRISDRGGMVILE